MHHVKMIEYKVRYPGELFTFSEDKVALFDGRDISGDEVNKLIREGIEEDPFVVLMTKEQYDNVFRSLRSTCVGCKYEPDCPSHIKCHGCAKMYTDNFETEE